MTEENKTAFLTLETACGVRNIAFRQSGNSESGTSVVWLGGFRSDMTGTKAEGLAAEAERLGLHFLRFDYSGHGASSGHYSEGSIAAWLEEAMAVTGAHAGRNIILAGSSMGGWIALRLYEEFQKAGWAERICGMVLIAPAPDFVTELIEPNLSEAALQSQASRGYFEETSEYSAEPNRFTRTFIEDGRNNRVLAGILPLTCPVHILQGMKDMDVPFSLALKIMEKIPSGNAVLTLIGDGDHRLSRPQDLALIYSALEAVARQD